MGIIKDAWDIVKEKAEWKETQALAKKVPDLERRIAVLEQQLSENPSGEVCEHCGSINLKRSGTKPNPQFGKLGVKDALYSCRDCMKETSITIPIPKSR
jgi:hypothetical protein